MLSSGKEGGRIRFNAASLHGNKTAMSTTHAGELLLLLLTLDVHFGHIKRRADPRSSDRHGSHGIRVLMEGLSDLEFHVLDGIKDTETVLVKDDAGCAVIMTLVPLALVLGFGFRIGVDLAGDKGGCRINEGPKGVLAGFDACVPDRSGEGFIARGEGLFDLCFKRAGNGLFDNCLDEGLGERIQRTSMKVNAKVSIIKIVVKYIMK